MSWSLKIQNGDLQLGPRGGFNTVTGAAKLTQDLRCAILEPLGTDSMHPSYGSTLDGGTDPTTGRDISSLIGTPNDSRTAALVHTELNRIIRNYQAQQIARNQSDVSIYGKSTLTTDETLLSLVNVSIQQIQDNMLIVATLQTGLGEIPVAIPISSA